MSDVKILHRLFRHSPWHYVTAALLGAVVTLICLIRDGFAVKLAWVNGLTVSGAVLILLGLLGLVSHYGAFDMFGYSFSVFRKRRYDSLFEYSEAKKEKHGKAGWSFMPYIAVGAVFLLCGLLIWNL